MHTYVYVPPVYVCFVCTYPFCNGQIEVEKMRRAERLLHKGQEGMDTHTSLSAADTTSKMATTASPAVGEGLSAAISAQDTPARSRKRKVSLHL